MAGLSSGPVYAAFFYGQEKFRIRGVAANCTSGHTVSDPETQPCSLSGSTVAAVEACELLEADGLSPANCVNAGRGMEQTRVKFGLPPLLPSP